MTAGPRDREAPWFADARLGSDAARRRLVALSLALALAAPVASAACLLPLVENLPIWDQWSLAPLWSAHFEGRPVLPLLLEPYNGHLNLLPRFAFYGIGLLSGWDVRWENVASYVAASGTLGLLLAMLARLGANGLLLAAAVAAQVFCFHQFENFVTGYPFGQNLSQLLATLVVFLLTRPRLGAVTCLGAAAAAAGATFSWGAGLAAFYVGAVALWLHPDRPLPWLGAWLAATLAASAAVRAGAGAALGAIDWAPIPRFYLTVIGTGWAPVALPRVGLATWLGAPALAAFAGLSAWGVRRLPRTAPWLLLGLLALASGGLISLGRAPMGVAQAIVSHYVTATYPLIVACTVLAFLALEEAARGDRFHAVARALAAMVAILPLLQSVVVSARTYPYLVGWSEIVHRNAREIAGGSASDETIRKSHHPDPALVRAGVEVLRAHRLSWFRAPPDAGS